MTKGGALESRSINVERLRLDPDNPRLPEAIQGESQETILEYLFHNAVLDELAVSFLQNSFFDHEALLVHPKNGAFVVVEGNRRLAASMVLLQLPPAVNADLAFALEPSSAPESLTHLRTIPTFLVENEEEVRRSLSFRHIGGLRTWSPEAKARYILDEVERTLPTVSPGENVFTAVARRVGGNTQGIRNPYVAIKILLSARDDLGIATSWVQEHRFGVWVRLLNSQALREYIDFGNARTYQEIQVQPAEA